ncbi:MAG: UDP-2,3-diacylglucosamine diphosphatase [Bacteroidota bacterium]
MSKSFEHIKSLEEGKKLYFASDFHLGAPDQEASQERERRIIRWIDFTKRDAAAFFFVGDIFDFWYEYSKVIPKGFVRFIGKIAELHDQGIPVYFFGGNHDMWMYSYFQKEIGIEVILDPVSFECNGKYFHISHGDGLGPGDYFYKFLKKIFRGSVTRFFFHLLHPDLGIGLAHAWSKSSRSHNSSKSTNEADSVVPDKEILLSYSKSIQEKTPHDYYIFGHRHIPMSLQVSDKSYYYNLGEWIKYFTYGVYEKEDFHLMKFEG